MGGSLFNKPRSHAKSHSVRYRHRGLAILADNTEVICLHYYFIHKKEKEKN